MKIDFFFQVINYNRTSQIRSNQFRTLSNTMNLIILIILSEFSSTAEKLTLAHFCNFRFELNPDFTHKPPADHTVHIIKEVQCFKHKNFP